MRIGDLLASMKGRVAATFGRWRQRKATSKELDCCDPLELAEMAHDLGIGPSELKRLARHGNQSADLLHERLRQLGMAESKIELPVIRDMQRCCTFCADKKICRHELDHANTGKRAHWPEYCPNAPTLAALKSERK
jgi:hypothetical protein